MLSTIAVPGRVRYTSIEEAIKINPNFAEAYANRGLLYAELKQTKKAKIDLQQAAILFRQQDNMAAYERYLK
jgi:Flp pilus assembly protein TadD